MSKRKIIDHITYFIASSMIALLYAFQAFDMKYWIEIEVINFFSIILGLVMSRDILKTVAEAAKSANYDVENQLFLYTLPIYIPGTNTIYALFLLYYSTREKIKTLISK